MLHPGWPNFSPAGVCGISGTYFLLSYQSRRRRLTIDIKTTAAMVASSKIDVFQSPDYFCLDELLKEEHKMVRDAVRSYVKAEISPIIEEYAQKAEFPRHIVG